MDFLHKLIFDGLSEDGGGGGASIQTESGQVTLVDAGSLEVPCSQQPQLLVVKADSADELVAGDVSSCVYVAVSRDGVWFRNNTLYSVIKSDGVSQSVAGGDQAYASGASVVIAGGAGALFASGITYKWAAYYWEGSL